MFKRRRSRSPHTKSRAPPNPSNRSLEGRVLSPIRRFPRLQKLFLARLLGNPVRHPLVPGLSLPLRRVRKRHLPLLRRPNPRVVQKVRSPLAQHPPGKRRKVRNKRLRPVRVRLHRQQLVVAAEESRKWTRVVDPLLIRSLRLHLRLRPPETMGAPVCRHACVVKCCMIVSCMSKSGTGICAETPVKLQLSSSNLDRVPSPFRSRAFCFRFWT